MNEIRTRYFNDTPKLDGDLTAYFESLWRHLDARENRAVKSDAARPKVRLGCTGELADIDSMGLVVRNSATELVEFLCPRCERLHASVPFR